MNYEHWLRASNLTTLLMTSPLCPYATHLYNPSYLLVKSSMDAVWFSPDSETDRHLRTARQHTHSLRHIWYEFTFSYNSRQYFLCQVRQHCYIVAGAKYCYQHACMFVCLFVCLSVRSHISKFRLIFCTCYTVAVVGLPAKAVRYVMYFRFCGWCRQNGQNQRRRV